VTLRRGTWENPENRFARTKVDRGAAYADQLTQIDEWGEPIHSGPGSKEISVIEDHAETFLTKNDSPDLGFSWSANPYRGCEHGCSYCYARPYHEYLGYSAGLDFETKIVVKPKGPEILRGELSSKAWKAEVIAMSGVTDCYQPLERRLGLTRRVLEVLAEFGQPVGIVTKNHLVTRDIDLLQRLASVRAATVAVSLTTLDRELSLRMEPRASLPEFRLRAVETLTAAGVPVSVNVAPVIPGLNDAEIPRLVEAAAKAGAYRANFSLIRLPYGVKEIFGDWLERELPHKREGVLGRIRTLRGGRLNDPRFGTRMRGEGAIAKTLHDLFRVAVARCGLNREPVALSAASFRRPPPDGQLELQLEPG
jgi:DNA repair photolyase